LAINTEKEPEMDRKASEKLEKTTKQKKVAEFLNMNKLQVKPTGAFGFHCENLPQAVNQYLRKLSRKTNCDIRFLMRGGLNEMSQLQHHDPDT
jgi:hypothetical protein